MSTPTFNSTLLVSRAGRDLPGSPDVRIRTETLPGVDGQFVQPHGTVGRKIIVRGVLETTGESPDLAHQALKAALRTKQELADGDTVATYVGTDGQSYQNCMLTSYEPVGEVHVTPGDSNYRAIVFIEARILHMTP